ncbi:MAG: hypothetical protein ACI9BO_002284 [Zhongshania sp.]|jgi:hypothetical protein
MDPEKMVSCREEFLAKNGSISAILHRLKFADRSRLIVIMLRFSRKISHF